MIVAGVESKDGSRGAKVFKRFGKTVEEDKLKRIAQNNFEGLDNM